MGVEEGAEIVYVGYVGGAGGEAVQLLELAAGVAAQGKRVTLVAPDLLAMETMATRYKNSPNLTIALTPLIRYGRVAQDPRDVLRLLQKHRAPVTHLYTGDIAIPRMTLMALEVLRPPRVFATIQSAYAGDMPVGSRRARYWASAARRRLAAVICPSRHGRDSQVAYGVPAEKAVTIPNSADTRRCASGDGGIARRALGLAADTPLIVFTARLHEQKRPGDALAAFVRLAQSDPDVHIAFVGTGPLEGEVKEAAEKSGLAPRIHFAGFQTNIPDWLAAATVWILPSEAENFSLGVIEALAAGCAVVATNCRGNDEILRHEHNSLLAPVGDIDGLSNGLRRLLHDPALHARLRHAARTTAQDYDTSVIAAQHLRLYDGASA